MSKVWAWLDSRPADPPKRKVSILMWAALVVTPVGTVYGFYRDSQADIRASDLTRCEQRVESRASSRARALTNIDYISNVLRKIEQRVGIPDDLWADLLALEDEERSLVDEQLPPITIDQCLAEVRGGRS